MGVVLITRIEKAKQWWRLRLSFKNATIFVCLLNILTAILLLQPFLFASPRKPPSHLSISEQINYIKESEEIRRAMEPVELIKRVREIEKEVYVETEPVQQKDTKQAVAVNLISRLNDFHINSDAASMKECLSGNEVSRMFVALEEWRMRKIERAKQRGLGKNATITLQ
ncbi:uncharacterized protein LOC141676883 isoform X4 [Apium graveolens]|uniref:uncharacterized protein LOC141676883 isoform X4 n=1 Tax=Apium graveolens TaxID=4045 RepID=UPI003D7A2462